MALDYNVAPSTGSMRTSYHEDVHCPTSRRQWKECFSGFSKEVTEGFSKRVPRSIQNLSITKPSRQTELPPFKSDWAATVNNKKARNGYFLMGTIVLVKSVQFELPAR